MDVVEKPSCTCPEEYMLAEDGVTCIRELLLKVVDAYMVTKINTYMQLT